ncbi:polysaccharide biosynthesis protein [Flavobacterium akiainvivens]|uniref:Polysaccharide biosynthesis protein n=1 Tax=Flavobacterium akiainvivens TaxID=1202724 RepID=A0A0M8MIV6_9FLAO|nr:polysaccharide biosynthesis C-terminal domain-containing protein [Flavobacterium akiainvivens]KOS07121.1 polysaccharide biosynthesis protein [Flavobacterium akiainvivens]SFQ75834.1 Membrane protein involved in the export of O-antigen and teichoic acid [Flavobacterium akiainvivens]
MSLYKKLFQQTAIYGIATVVPRMFSFLLTPLYTTPGVMDRAKYGEVSIIFAWLVFFNVVLAYGMETAFFRFYNSDDKKQVMSTGTMSLVGSSLIFLAVALLGRQYLAAALGIETQYVTYTIWVLVLDALAIVPFSRLRAEGRPIFFAAVKIGNVVLTLLLNLFFLLWLPQMALDSPDGFMATLYIPHFQVGYVFVANVMASLATLIVLLPHYFKISWHFNTELWKRMMRYALPVMVAGVAFAINETFDRPLLKFMKVPEAEIGVYSACYRLAIFMTLFTTAFRLGIEPFFFSHAKSENATKTYAAITQYFVIMGSVILLGVIVFADLLKWVLLRDKAFWEAMDVVPVIILANFFLGIYTNLSVWYKLSDKTKMGAYISLVGAGVTLAFNFALIPLWGYVGSAIATVAAYGTMMVVSYKLGAKYYPIPYNIRKMIFYPALAMVLGGISFYVPFLRHTYAFGILAFAGYIWIIFRLEKETLLKFIKK